MPNVIRADQRGRGSGAHQLVDEANHFYRARGVALIDRVEPPARGLKPIGDGKFEARLTKGSVDYHGGVKVGLGSQAIAFDLKATGGNALDLDPGHISQAEVKKAFAEGRRPRVRSKVPLHQVEFLTDAERCGFTSFWLVQFTKHRRHFVLAHRDFLAYFKPPYRIGLEVFEKVGIEVFPEGLCSLHYLAGVEYLMPK